MLIKNQFKRSKSNELVEYCKDLNELIENEEISFYVTVFKFKTKIIKK
jgi:hypothetical protein